MFAWRGAWVVAVVTSGASLAQAQPLGKPPPPPPGSRAAAPAAAPAVPVSVPDIVVLHDGSMVRGTIIELKRGEYVLITTPLGESRRFSMNEVRYAGPASGAPGTSPPKVQERKHPPAPPRPPLPVGPPMHRVALSSPDPDVTFHARGGLNRLYTQLCTAPCETSFEEGPYIIALSRGRDEPRKAKGSLTIDQPGTLEGKFVSRSNLRTIGWVLIPLGPLLGGVLIAGSVSGGATEFNAGMFFGGMALFGGGLATGIVLATRKDLVEVTFYPGAVASLPRPSSLALVHPAIDRSSPYAPGLTAVGRF